MARKTIAWLEKELAAVREESRHYSNNLSAIRELVASGDDQWRVKLDEVPGLVRKLRDEVKRREATESAVIGTLQRQNDLLFALIARALDVKNPNSKSEKILERINQDVMSLREIF